MMQHKMNIIQSNKKLEYFSLVLILSNLIFHQIIPLLIGIAISIYCLFVDQRRKESDNQIIRKEKEINVVDHIEEFGFIPSSNQININESI